VIQFELDTDRQLFTDAMVFAQKQIRNLAGQHPDFHPMYTQQGKWRHQNETWTQWTDGFLAGLMWLFHRHSPPGSPEADRWMDLAIRYTEPLENRKFDQTIHDHGLLFMPTYGRWYARTKETGLNEVLVQAGQTLAQRFQEKGQYLSSFISESSVFIDIMMNVGIVFYAARETGDRTLRDIASRHCLTTRRVLVRGDGSVAQEGLFDTTTGEFLRQSTQQGYRSDSCWSRGLAWALYGFTTSYEYSLDPRFLDTAEACADYYLIHSPTDGVPPWDFLAPSSERTLLDTSAAAIVAAGMLRLCRLIPDTMKGHLYWTAALKILRSLCEKYVVRESGNEGILKGGLYHVHKNLGINESVIWGEYYFVEALGAALRRLNGN
jgi:unsaturated chondroitin disaccharide hydrolase